MREFTETELVEIYYAVDEKKEKVENGAYGDPSSTRIKEWLIDLQSILNKLTSEVIV